MADQQKSTAKKHLGLILRVGITILACLWVAKGMDFSKVGDAFSRTLVWPTVLIWPAVIGIFIFSNILLSLRWWLLMRGVDIHVNFWSTIKLVFLGLYFNNCLPGSIGGDLVRAWYVTQYTHRRMVSVISVFVDRVLAMLGTVIIAVTALIVAKRGDIFTRQNKSGISGLSSQTWIIILAAAGILVAAGIIILVVPSTRKICKSMYKKGIQYGKQAVLQMFQVLVVLFKKPYLVPESIGLTLFLQGLVVFSLSLIGSQMGIKADLELYFVFFPVMWVVGSVPIGIAGIGIVEGGLVFLFTTYASASPDTATALALSQRIIWILASLPGLAVYLSGKHLPKDIIREFSVDEKKTIQ